MLKPIEHWKNTLGKLGMRVQRRRVGRKSVDLGCSFETLESRIAMSIDSPVIAGLLASPTSVALGNQITLTATGVTDPNGDAISHVQFFRDIDSDGVLTGADGSPLATDTDGSNGWSSSVSTAGFAAGDNRFFAVARDATNLDSDPIAATATVLLPPQIIDNGGAGYSLVSSNYWSTSGGGYGGGHQFEFGATGGYAQWTFANLPDGEYRVSATWVNGSNHGTNVPYTVFDGSLDVGTTRVNQRVAPAADVVAGSKNFQHLGSFTVVNGSLVVRMTNSSGDGRAIADAVLIQHLGPAQETSDIRVFDGSTELTDAASTVNLGTTFYGTPSATKTLTVKNVGLADLVLTPLTQANMPAGVTLVSSYAATTLARGASTTFQLRLSGTSTGAVNGSFAIASNDSDENGFDIAISGVVDAVKLIDNSSTTGYSTVSSGYWSTTSGGYSGGHQFEFGASGGYAQWTFSSLPAGEYRVSATWLEGSNRGTNVPYTAFDGSYSLGAVPVNQRVAPAANVVVGGKNFQDLGSFSVINGTLVVRITNSSGDGRAIADAIRIEHLGPAQQAPEIRVLNGGAELYHNSSTVNLGTTFFGTPTAATTLTVTNSGTTGLVLAPLTQQNMPAGVTLVSSYASATLAPGASTTFQVALAATTTGTVGGVLSIASNDADESSFDITLSGVVNASKIIDNGDVGYSTVSSNYWTTTAGHQFEFGATGGYAEWSFPSLPAGEYRISAAWPADSKWSSIAPYSIMDGASTLSTVKINQTLAPEADVVSGGRDFQDLGFFGITNGSLVVRLTNSGAKGVVADAIRVEYVGKVPEVRFTDSSSEFVVDGAPASTLDFGQSERASKAVEVIAVTNNSTSTLSLTQITQGNLPTGFLLLNGFGASSLAPGASAYARIRLDAILPGPYSGTIPIQAGTQSFNLAVTGEVLKTPVLVDNGDPGFATTGSGWQNGTAGTGFGDAHLKATGASPGRTASWTIDGLASGAYLVYATYLPSAGNTDAAPYSLYDGTTLEKQFTVNQQQSASVAPVVSGKSFGYVGQINVSSGTLKVELDASNLSGGQAIADAIYLVPRTLGEFHDLSAPSSFVTNSDEAITVGFVDPDGELADSINVYRDTNGNGVLDIGTDQLFHSDANPSDGLDFDLSTLASGVYSFFVAMMDAGAPVAVTQCTCSCAKWWIVEITQSRTKGEAKYNSSGDLTASTEPIKAPASMKLDDFWKAAVWARVSGTVTTNNTDQPATHVYPFAPTGTPAYPDRPSAYQVGTQNDVAANPGHNRLVGDGATKLIVLEDLTFSSNLPNDFDYDDQYWIVSVTRYPTTETESPEPGTCSCNCGCSSASTTNTGSASENEWVTDSMPTTRDTNTNPHPIVRVADTLPTTFAGAPDSIEVSLDFGGVDQGTVFYTGAGFAPGDDVFLAVQADATGWDSGRYGWEMLVRYRYGTQSEYRIFTGTQDLVSRTDNELGRGLSITEIDKLIPGPTGVNLITGTNHAIWFPNVGGGSYAREDGFQMYSSLVNNGDGTFTLTMTDGTKSHFDGYGRLTSRVDSVGNTRTYAYTPAGKISSITDHVGRVTSFNYTGSRISSIVEFDGEVTTLTHDGTGQLLSVTQPDPDGAGPQTSPVTTYTYHAGTGLLASIVDPRSEVTLIDYDHARNVSRLVQPCGGTSTYVMYRSLGVADLAVSGSSAGNPAPLTSANAYEVRRDEHGFETHIKRDRFGNPIWERDALGHITTIDRNEHGMATKITQPDPDGPSGPLPALVTQFSYDTRGNVLQVTNPDGTHDTFTYDPTFSRPTGYTDPLGRKTLWDIDPANGNVLSVTEVVGAIDSLLNGETDDVTTSFTYTALLSGVPAGLVSTMTDALGRVTSLAYTARGLLESMTQAVGTADETTTTFEYDTSDNLTAVIDGIGRRTEYAYDNLHRLISLTQGVPSGAGPAVAFWQFAYDASGNRTSMTDPLGNVTQYVYDDRGRLSEVIQADPDGVGPLTSPTTTYDFNCVNNLVGIADALGRATTYEYDGLRRMVRAILPDPDGAGPNTAPTVEMAYNNVGWVTSETDPLGNATTYTYDAMGRVKSVTQADPDGAGPATAPVTSAVYDAAGQILSVTDPLGRVTSYTYDDLGRITSVTQPDPDGAGSLASPQTFYGYDKLGNVTSITDPLGHVTLFGYDNLDRLTQITQADPDGAGPLTSPVTTYAFDAASQVTSVTDPLGRVTTYAYDILGRLTTVTSPDPDGAGPLASPVMTYEYDAVGNVTCMTDPLGHVTAYAYDNLYRLTSVTQPDPDGAGPLSSPVTTFTYDIASQLVSTTDPLGRVTTMEYDDLGRLTKEIQPDPDGAGPDLAAFMVYTYDLVGNMLTESDRLGNTTSYTYDNLYRATKVTDANGKDTLLAYDIVGNRLSLTDSVGNTTQWFYDGLDRVVQEENELGDSRYFAYDVASRLIERTDRNGRVTEFTYDNLNRQTSEKWLSGSSVVKEFAYTYDVASQLTAVGDDVADYTYQYDGLGRVTQWTTDLASLTDDVVLNQTFDAASRRTSLFATLGATADFKNDFGYDALNRLTTITQQGQAGGNTVAEKRIDFKYLADGRTSEINRFADVAGTQNVVNTALGYDGAGRLTGMTHAKGATTFADYGWAYDAADRMTAFTNTVYPSEDAAYTHDSTGQLTGADRTGSGDDESYVYDDNGNRVTANGDTYTTSANNRIASDGTNSYTYDAEGNITRITNIATGDYRDLSWDYRNRLVKVTQCDSSAVEQWRVEYAYDAFNRLVGRMEFVGGSSTPASDDTLIYDGYQMILKLDASGNVESRTLWGAGVDHILATEDAAGNVKWPLTDHLNTVRDIVSYDAGTNTSTLENHIVYDSFGNVVSETNPSVPSDFLFTARYTDATTGLQWNLNRWYVSPIGKWASEDPIGFSAADPNLTRYVGNGPMVAVDPSGAVIAFSNDQAAATFIDDLKALGARAIYVERGEVPKNGAAHIVVSIDPADMDAVFAYADIHHRIPDSNYMSCALYDDSTLDQANQEEQRTIKELRARIDARNRFLLAAGITGISEDIVGINGRPVGLTAINPYQTLLKAHRDDDIPPIVIDHGGETGANKAINVNVTTTGTGPNAGKPIPRLLLRGAGGCDGPLPFGDHTVSRIIVEGSPIPNAGEVLRLLKPGGQIEMRHPDKFKGQDDLVRALRKSKANIAIEQSHSGGTNTTVITIR
jgi:RHS repeat-associated protein